MPRSKRQERTAVDELFDMLCQVPAWVGPVVAAAAFAGCRWVLPWALGSLGGFGGGQGAGASGGAASDSERIAGGAGAILAMFSHNAAPFVLLGVLAIWLAAEFKKRTDRARLDRQTGPESIAALSWSEFESLLAEAFRREGFAVDQAGGPRPDGGVDLRLSKAGAITLVQCKHWKTKAVGVRIVRELLGVVASDNAASGIAVTSGTFTAEARAFAEHNPVRLIDGEELGRMIAAVQKQPRPKPVSSRPSNAQQAAPPKAGPSAAAAEPTCPLCESPMVRRVAKRGPNAGSAFFGCSRYPACRGTRPIEAAQAGGAGVVTET